ncbi:MAG TPA: cation:proton antiporter [Polyangiales bacterium]|nr:cation:proton antiporter [Polyangiales bacterium]
MSHAQASSTQSLWVTRSLQALGLAVVFVAVYVATHLAPAFEGPFGVISAVGFLLLAGMLASNVFEVIGLPHLTAYIMVGVVAGPHVLHLVDHEAVEDLAPVNTLALALIALAGGAELRLPLLMPLRKSLAWTTLTQCVIGTVACSAAFLAASRMLPFTHGLPLTSLIGVALLWGVLAVSRSPSACLGILAQTRPDGPLTRFSLAFVMASDIVVAILVTLTITLVRPLVDTSAGISLRDLMALWHEILGSITLGTTVGLLLALYLWLVSGQLLLVLLALGFGLTAGLHYLHFDPLLTFLTAGFVVANFSSQGPKLLHAVEDTGSVVFVVFFATAGAHLDVPLVKQLWPVTLLLAGVRVIFAVFAHRLGSRIAGDLAVVQRWGWAPLVSQAGLTLGMSALIASAFPSFGPGFRSLAVATVAVNELVGPVLFKMALDRTGESGKATAGSAEQAG